MNRWSVRSLYEAIPMAGYFHRSVENEHEPKHAENTELPNETKSFLFVHFENVYFSFLFKFIII